MRQVSFVASVLLSRFQLFISALGPIWDVRKYHPERHYMRGPGPKWREKHSSRHASSVYGR